MIDWTDGIYQLMEVINWRKLSTDGSYQLIKVRDVRIAIEVKRSDVAMFWVASESALITTAAPSPIERQGHAWSN